MPGKRQHRRKREDPLVAIDGVRVRAAIEWKGMSVNRAAQRMNVSQQTLDSIVRGKTKRCYQSLRETLAKLVGVPGSWLGGEAGALPSLTSWLPYPNLGYEPPLWVDENMRIIRPPAGGGIGQRGTLAPRYQLAAQDLSKRITDAWKRDVEQGMKGAKAALAQLAVGRWKDNAWDRVNMLVARLISAFWWRRAVLKNPKVNDQTADDEFAVSAASALTAILEPWLKGRQELDYHWLVDTLEWASAGFGKHPGEQSGTPAGTHAGKHTPSGGA